MLFFAYHRDEYLISGTTLDAVLAFAAECNEPQFQEDAVVWRGGRIVAISRADGSIVRFDGPPPVPPAAEVPADLARLAEAAA
ncbi:MAG TPA: hypothetical protein VKA46_29675 [Gemmataceae bacterium]|nr:hypothetical protein [Gemmataceae bacterium]